MVQKQIQPEVFLAQLHQHGAQQRSAFHVKRQSRALPPQAQRFRLPFFHRQIPQVDYFELRLIRRIHHLHRLSVDHFKGCPPGFMPPHDLREAASQRCHIQRPPAEDRDRLVVQVLGELAVQPDLLLCK